MIRLISVFLAASIGSAWSAEPVGPAIAKAIRETTLDPDACFRVREMNFNREDFKVYLTDGFLIFAKPVMGQRLFAVFSAELEGGDAEILLIPPHRSERRSLASFAHSPTLDEHFRTALLLFSDGSGEELFKDAGDAGRKSLEMGALMKDRWTPLAHNISAGFEVRLVQDLLSPDRSLGFFFAAIGGNNLGNFDVVHDLSAREQIVTGQYTTRGSQPTFDVWTSFESKSVRTGRRKPPKPSFELSDFRINATLDPVLHMQAVTRAKLTPSVPSRAFALNVSDKVRITGVVIDGEPVEIYARESMRDAAIRGGGNTTYVAITSAPLPPGRAHEIEIHHEGDVVVPAGNQVYYVTSRGNWYPRNGSGFATYDLTFRYPKNLTLVATGDSVEERVEGDSSHLAPEDLWACPRRRLQSRGVRERKARPLGLFAGGVREREGGTLPAAQTGAYGFRSDVAAVASSPATRTDPGPASTAAHQARLPVGSDGGGHCRSFRLHARAVRPASHPFPHRLPYSGGIWAGVSGVGLPFDAGLLATRGTARRGAEQGR